MPNDWNDTEHNTGQTPLRLPPSLLLPLYESTQSIIIGHNANVLRDAPTKEVKIEVPSRKALKQSSSGRYASRDNSSSPSPVSECRKSFPPTNESLSSSSSLLSSSSVLKEREDNNKASINFDQAPSQSVSLFLPPNEFVSSTESLLALALPLSLLPIDKSLASVMAPPSKELLDGKELELSLLSKEDWNDTERIREHPPSARSSSSVSARHKNGTVSNTEFSMRAPNKSFVSSSTVLLSNDLNDRERIVDHPPSVRSSESLSSALESSLVLPWASAAAFSSASAPSPSPPRVSIDALSNNGRHDNPDRGTPLPPSISTKVLSRKSVSKDSEF